MAVQKLQYWLRDSAGHKWVRFVFEIEGSVVRFLEYTPNGMVPYQGEDKLRDRAVFWPGWTAINVEEASKVVGNMIQQDAEFGIRLTKKGETESLANAMKVLNGKTVSSVTTSQNSVLVSAEDGSSYEIAFSSEGFVGRRVGLPDPW